MNEQELLNRIAELEQQLAEALYQVSPDRAVVLGEGVDTDWTGSAERFREEYGLRAPFVLYAGRRSRAKNTHVLTSFFGRYRRDHQVDLDLVLIGSGDLSTITAEEYHIHDLGFVPLQDKHDAYAAASVLCQPSIHESFSLVIMEAWLASRCAFSTGCCFSKA